MERIWARGMTLLMVTSVLAACGRDEPADPWVALSDSQLTRLLDGDPQFTNAGYPTCGRVLLDPPGASQALATYLASNTFAAPADHTVAAVTASCTSRIIEEAKAFGYSITAPQLQAPTLRDRATKLGLSRR